MWFATRRAHIQRWLRKDSSEIRDHLDSIYFDFLTLNDAFHSQDEQKTQTIVPQEVVPYFTSSNTPPQVGTTFVDSLTSEMTESVAASREQNINHNNTTLSSTAVRPKQSSSNFVGEMWGQQKDISHKLETMHAVSQPQEKVTLAKHRKISWGVYPPARKVAERSLIVQETARTPVATPNKAPPIKAPANRGNKASRNSKDKSPSLADISKILLRPKGRAVIERKLSDSTETSHTGPVPLNHATSMSRVSRDKSTSFTGFSKSVIRPNEGRGSLEKKANDTTNYVEAIMNYQFYPPVPRNLSDFAEWSYNENWV